MIHLQYNLTLYVVSVPLKIKVLVNVLFNAMGTLSDFMEQSKYYNP